MELVETAVARTIVEDPCPDAQARNVRDVCGVTTNSESAIGNGHRAPLLTEDPVHAVVAIERTNGPRTQGQRSVEEL